MVNDQSTVSITFAPAEAVREEKRHLSARSGLSALWWAMRRGVLAARESRNELPWLAPEKARELFDRWLRGEWAQPQWAWELMEKYDETLFAVKRARLAALNEMPWQVVVDADAVGDDAARQALAEAQRQKLVELLGNVENLRAALTYLGMADFRGIAALEITGNEERMRWEVIEPWLLCRPNLAGPIMYNERAEDTPAHPELLERERVILRTAEPIDLPAMFLLTAKHHGTQAWDAFLDTFGIPSIFLETPPNTTEEQAQEYQQKVEEIVGEGRGTIPSGAKFHTVETGQKETKSFQERADWCKNALLILATGGLLTITAQSGSGTLAGNAHADSFERLCAATAQDISTVVDFQFCRPALQSIFPGQPILAHFELAPEKEEDLAAQAQIIATLAGAGFKPSAEVVSEMMGFEVAAVEQQADFGSRILDVGFNSSAASPQAVTNSKAETPAPQAPNFQIQNQTSKIQNHPNSEPPLSEAELAAFATLATPNPARMAQRQREVEAALRAAADLPAADAPQAPSSQIQNPTSNIQNSEDCRAASPEHCRAHGEAEDDGREPWEKRQEERERLEALRDELDRQEEAARDAEASGDPSHYNEQAARDRWSALSREGDPQTREDIERRLAELAVEDAAEEDVVTNKKGMSRGGCRAQNQANCPTHGTGAGIHKQKGSRTTKGNPSSKTQQSNIPTNLPSHATDGQLERQIKKGLDAVDAHKGNQTVSRGKEKYTLTQERSDHRSKHKDERVSNEQIAKTLTQGEFEKDEMDAVAYRKNNKVIKKGNRRDGADITTTHIEKNYDLHKHKKKPGQEPSSTGR
ncbi:MAG: DUF935 family protein [Akkermansiaceae bacterium]|nr:DUF935 family protein [Akkermansiaceae bacterium]